MAKKDIDAEIIEVLKEIYSGFFTFDSVSQVSN
jgi:hypothetical protein